MSVEEEESDLHLFARPTVPVATVEEHKSDNGKKQKVENTAKETTTKGFAALGLDPWLVNTLTALSMSTPTAVQSACIPAALHPRTDIIGVAQTGSGKTAAFALPILNTLNKDPWGPFAVVLTPTRELAVQIDEQFRVFGRDVLVKTLLCIGGMDIVEQANGLLKRPHIVIATPGRLADLVSSSQDLRALFKRCRFVVIDEADRLLEETSKFKPELEAIFECCYNEKEPPQTLLFTATLTDSVTNFSRLQPNPFVFKGNAAFGTADTVNQRYLFIPSKVKDCYLYHLLTTRLEKATVIVFVGKCVTAELLTLSLRQLQVHGGVVSLHSKHPQRQRLSSLQLFKNGSARILIATDVAARGLDIPQVHTVLNYDIPADPRDYVHRIGRTGRAGLSGNALSFVSELDIDLVQAIEEKTGRQMAEMEPALDEDKVLEALNKCSDARQWASMRLQDINFFTNRKKK